MTTFNIKHSVSRIVKDYKYSVIIILSLSVSLAVSLFLYSQVYSIKHKALPFERAEDVVLVARMENGNNYVVGGLSDYEVHYYAKNQTSLDLFCAFEDRNFTVVTDDFTDQVFGAATSSNLFKVAQKEPILGRALVAADDEPGAPPVVVLSYNTWTLLFDKSNEVVGKSLFVDAVPTTIVGIMPEGFAFPYGHDMWLSYIPKEVSIPETDGWNSFVGRLRPGVSVSQARSELLSLSNALLESYPKKFQGKTLAVGPFTEAFRISTEIETTILTIVAVAILALGCLSVANLLIVRSLERNKEISIKKALGIPFSRILSPLLLESLLLCTVSGMIALFLCSMAMKGYGEKVLDGPFWWVLEFNSSYVLIAIAVIFVIWLLTGALPAWVALSNPIQSGLNSGRKGSGGTQTSMLMRGFISVQVACAFILMVFTGLCLVGLYKTISADYGVEKEGFVTANIKLSEKLYPTIEDRVEYYEKLANKLKSESFSVDVAYTGGLPGSFSYLRSYTAVDQATLSKGSYPKALEFPSSENFFEMLGIELLQGRVFNALDDSNAELVAIINHEMAQKLWPDSSPIGKQFQVDPTSNGVLLTVVGVTPTIIYGSPINFADHEYDIIYRPMKQVLPAWAKVHIAVKVRGKAKDFINHVKKIARETDSRIALTDVLTYEERLARNGSRFEGLLYNFVPASILALIMSALGIYSITSRIILQSKPDIGVMKAVGVTDFWIVRKFLFSIVKLFAIGILIGVIVVAWVLPEIASQVKITDHAIVVSLGVIALIITAMIVFMAILIPISSINRLTPVDALTSDI